MASVAFCVSVHPRLPVQPSLLDSSFRRCHALDRAPHATRLRSAAANRCVVHMKKKSDGSDGKRRRPSGFSKEQNERLKKVAEKYGVAPPKAGERLDRQFTSAESRATDAKEQEQEQALYRGIVGLFGQETLDKMETATYFILAVLLVGFLGTGLAIGAEAFFKASNREIPQSLDSVSVQLEKAFTPLLIGFLTLSSMLGLYKQAQLSAGAAQYDESKPSK